MCMMFFGHFPCHWHAGKHPGISATGTPFQQSQFCCCRNTGECTYCHLQRCRNFCFFVWDVARLARATEMATDAFYLGINGLFTGAIERARNDPGAYAVFLLECFPAIVGECTPALCLFIFRVLFLGTIQVNIAANPK